MKITEKYWKMSIIWSILKSPCSAATNRTFFITNSSTFEQKSQLLSKKLEISCTWIQIHQCNQISRGQNKMSIVNTWNRYKYLCLLPFVKITSQFKNQNVRSNHTNLVHVASRPRAVSKWVRTRTTCWHVSKHHFWIFNIHRNLTSRCQPDNIIHLVCGLGLCFAVWSANWTDFKFELTFSVSALVSRFGVQQLTQKISE